ncbi:MAG: penicillin-binding protein 2 [Peptoniphilaceae bacterium]|nr:penicillin-binding protein 2 [Peptoniphilaceae bacterium]MDD7383543.1 penicillin-binding protein 2 [Peptoniphilaceae bacterium]MDY3738716.1 penicillin-binding protein 2 [Peptoniphilaceae bacterium]
MNKKLKGIISRFFSFIKKREQIGRDRLNNIDYTNSGMEKSTVNKRTLVVLVFFIFLFMLLVLYLVYFQLFSSKKVAENDHNKRLWVDENEVLRGSILDRNGVVLAHTETDSYGNNYRVNDYDNLNSSVIGYNSTTYGKSGIEDSYNKDLLNIPEDTPISQLKSMVIDSDEGNQVVLTIDNSIQSIINDALGDKIGAVVVMRPDNGEVLGMISKPNFNPNNIDDNWESLIQDERAPLLNRATQGVYRPGSIMKIITATSIIDNNIDENYDDTGEEIVDGFKIHNISDQVFGQLDLRNALVHSSNTYFANKTLKVGKDNLKTTSEKYLFNKEYSFDLIHNTSKIPFDELDKTDLAMTGFGYGKTETTPLHMAMMVSAIANRGNMMQPRLVKYIVDSETGKIKKESQNTVLSKVTSTNTALKITDYMVSVVENGTGSEAYVPEINIAGKTGTAENEDGSNDSWFVGFYPADNPVVSIAIVLEKVDPDSGITAAPIAGQILSSIYYNVDLSEN